MEDTVVDMTIVGVTVVVAEVVVDTTMEDIEANKSWNRLLSTKSVYCI